MDIRKVKKLIEMMQESDISEIEVRDGEDAVRIQRGPADNASGSAEAIVPLVGRPRVQAYASLDGPVNFVRASVSGIFYRSNVEDVNPHRRLGEIVAAGEELGVIKSAEARIPILTEVPGLLMAMLVEDGALVSEGDRLFQVRQS